MFSDGHHAYQSAYRQGLMPDPEMWVDAWAADHAYIPADGNAEGGKYSIDRTPFAREVMHVLSPGHPCTRVVVMGASQLLKTQTAMNWIMASVDAAPANILALMPSGDLASRLSARINKTINATPRVVDLFAKPRTRAGKNTDSTKEFRGGTLHIATAGSAANLAEIPARYGYGDEIDDWEFDLQGQGDPVEIFENRGSTYGRNRKWYYSSSPKRPRGLSKILDLFEQGDQRYYHLPCPHCSHEHPLTFDSLRTDDDLTWAKMLCPECGSLIDEHAKTAMLAAGRWVPKATSSDGTISFTISQLYAPLGWTNWLDLARLHKSAQEALRYGDPTKMQAFYNTRLALPFDNNQSASTADQLRSRAEPYPLRVLPDRALVATATVDTQADRLEVQIEAWGPGMEHWVIDYEKIHGSPGIPAGTPGSPWNRVDEIRRTPLLHASGVPIILSAYGIDAGGANTQDVYNYGSQRQGLGCVVLHGANRPNRPIIGATPSRVDIEWGGAKTPGGAELWQIGTDVAKDYLLLDRMRLESGPGAMHFPQALDPQWFDQLVAERLLIEHKAGRTTRKWFCPKGVRNEATDLSVYNLGMAYKLMLHKWSALDWQRLRERLIPPTLDLFAPVAPEPGPPASQAHAKSHIEIAPARPSPSPPPPPPVLLQPRPAPIPIPVSQPQPTHRRVLSKGIS